MSESASVKMEEVRKWVEENNDAVSSSSVSSRASQRKDEQERLRRSKRELQLLEEKQEVERQLQLLKIDYEQLKQRRVLTEEIARTEAREKLLGELSGEEMASQDDEEELMLKNQNMGSGANPDISNDISQSPQDVKGIVAQLRKPQLEIKKFGGNRLRFLPFMRQFETLLEGVTNEDEKMAYLEQFTYGEANQIVQGYSFLDAKIGYGAAVKEFKERYGDTEAMAEEYIRRALAWNHI